MERLTIPQRVYQSLAALQVGDAAPPEVYILDEKDGTVPHWVLLSRRELGTTNGLALIFEDQTPRDEQPSLWEPRLHARRGILTWEQKTLATQPYLAETVEWGCPNAQMCDLIQQARIENKRKAQKGG